MSLSPLICELVTPEKLVFSGEATMVEAPGAEGDFGVLVGHMPLISTLRPGIVTIHRNDSDNLRIFVTGGVAEVTNERCTILAEEVEDLDKIDFTQAQSRLADAKREMDVAVTDEQKFDADRALKKAEALVQALA